MSNDNNYCGFDKVSLGMQFDMFAKEVQCYSKIMIIKVIQSKNFYKCLTATIKFDLNADILLNSFTLLDVITD